jgi:hypothetical protein
MAAFMGCESGEIEVGMSTAASGSSPVSLQQVFSEDLFQQSFLEELLHLPSSSLPTSVSVDSPAAAEGSTSLLRTTTMAITSAATPSSGGGEIPPLRHHPRPPLPAAPFGRHGGYVHFPRAESDDAMIAQAMLDVISATSSSSLLTPPPQGNHCARRWPRRVGTTAFREYNAAMGPRALLRRQPGAPGQRMIKMGISISRRMHHVLRFSREHDAMAQQQQQRGKQDDEAPATEPSSSQLNHMISERRRRERLNESFEALRGLLPPGSKVRNFIACILHEMPQRSLRRIVGAFCFLSLVPLHLLSTIISSI